MNETFIRDRITQLRMQKNVSEYRMSLELGHSKSYIQSISSGKSLPSLPEFISICEYLEVTPKEFFDTDLSDPQRIHRLFEYASTLNTETFDLLINVAKQFSQSPDDINS